MTALPPPFRAPFAPADEAIAATLLAQASLSPESEKRIDAEATQRQQAGIDAFEAARDIGRAIGARPDFGGWGEFGRIAVNVETVYRSLDPAHATPDVVEQFRRMARIEAGHGAG